MKRTFKRLEGKSEWTLNTVEKPLKDIAKIHDFLHTPILNFYEFLEDWKEKSKVSQEVSDNIDALAYGLVGMPRTSISFDERISVTPVQWEQIRYKTNGALL